jgi:hypothetical protein
MIEPHRVQETITIKAQRVLNSFETLANSAPFTERARASRELHNGWTHARNSGALSSGPKVPRPCDAFFFTLTKAS